MDETIVTQPLRLYKIS